MLSVPAGAPREPPATGASGASPIASRRPARGAPTRSPVRPPPAPRLNLRARLYVSAVITSGLGLLISFAILHGADLVRARLDRHVAPGRRRRRRRAGPDQARHRRGRGRPSTTFTFALLLSTGLAAAAIAVAVASGLSDLIDRKRPSRSAFNVAQYVLAIAAAGGVLLAAGVLPHHEEFTAADVPAILGAAAVFFVVNTGLVARRHRADHRLRACATRSPPSSSASRPPRASSWAWPRWPSSRSTRRRCCCRSWPLPMIAVQRAGRQALIAERLALHDALTGLPNRVLFRTRTQHADPRRRARARRASP